MKEDFSFLTNLIEMLKESTLLTERSRVETQINTTMLNLLYDITHFNKNDPNAEEKAKNIWDRIQKPINVSASNHAGYTWNGASIKTTKFLKSPRDVKVVQGDVETYKDPLWFYIDPTTKKLSSYLDDNGMIKPGHEDVIYRVNQKYGLQLNPNERIVKSGRGDTSNNAKQFDIWKNNFFIPWYKAHSTDGASLTKLYKQYVTGELPKDEKKPEEIKKEVPTQVTPEKQYDRTVIDSITKNFEKQPVAAWRNIVDIIKGRERSTATPQQVYNTLLNLYKQSTRNSYIIKNYPSMSETIYNMILEYKNDHSGLEGKMESVENSKKCSWLSRNGDYTIFDKLNNLFRLQKESKENDMTNTKLKVLQENDVFSSINTNENNFDPSKVSSDVFSDNEEKGAISEKDKLKKNRLVKDVLDKINDSLKLNKEVQNILDEIREINNGNDYNNWVVNEEGNTASLASKNAKIFKQNLNLCLSHDDKVEIFKSVSELHQWLKDHNYPMPKDIQLHESVNLKEEEIEPFVYSDDDPRHVYNGLGKWIEILNLDLIGKSKEEADKILKARDNQDSGLDEDFCAGNMGDTTSASLGTALQYLYKNKKNESLGKETFMDKLKSLKEDDTDVASNFDTSVQASAGFGSDNISNDSSNSQDSLNSAPSMDNDAVDLGQDQGNDNPSSFDDININTSGYGPDEGNMEENPMDMSIPQEEYQIIDVLSDSEDNIKVKVKNLDSGEIEYKDLSEIDI